MHCCNRLNVNGNIKLKRFWHLKTWHIVHKFCILLMVLLVGISPSIVYSMYIDCLSISVHIILFHFTLDALMFAKGFHDHFPPSHGDLVK